MAKRRKSRKKKTSSRRRSRRTRMKGFGQLRGGAKLAVPVVGASAVTAATTLGLRAFLQPQPGTTSEQLYRWAPAIGSGAGLVAAGMSYFLAGGNRSARTPAMVAAFAAVAHGGVLLLSERLNAAKPGAMAAVGGGAALPAGGAALPAGDAGAEGLSALMPEYAPSHYGLGDGSDGLGAIVMEPLEGAYGEQVNVSGLGAGYNPSAFGTSPY